MFYLSFSHFHIHFSKYTITFNSFYKIGGGGVIKVRPLQMPACLLYQFNATALKYIEIVYLAKDMDDNFAAMTVFVIGSGIKV